MFKHTEIVKITESIKRRFHLKIIKQDNGCWNWVSSITRDGYGTMWYNKKVVRAHRMSWAIYFGYVPENKLVLHTCDNKKCVNPEHLYIGNHGDNNADTIHRIKPKSGITSRFYEGELWLMKKLYSSGKVTLLEISKMFKCHLSHVSNIVRGKSLVSGKERSIGNYKLV